MKKLYKKGTVHPTPPLILDQLSFMPATILTLTATLSIEDREVLAYLLSCYSNNYACNKKNIKQTTTINSGAAAGGGGGGDHPPSFNCSCFRCYMSYWVRWDASPNRQLIHEVIDAFEEGLSTGGKKEKSKREIRKNRGGNSNMSSEFKKCELILNKDEFSESDSVEESTSAAAAGGGGEDGGREEVELEKGSVTRFINFVGEKIWSDWN